MGEGGVHCASETQAEHLLHEAETRDLSLATPQGEATWQRGARESVIDLTFLTSTLQNRLLFCGPEEHWAVTLHPDHIWIRIELDLAPQSHPRSKRFAIKKLNTDAFLQAINQSKWEAEDEPLTALQNAIQVALQ
jgi:hypothetical protein